LTKIHFKNGSKVLLLFLSILIAQPLMSQSRTVRKATKKQEQQDEQQKKDDEKAQKKGVKEHYKRQTDATQELMKQSHKNSKKFNRESKDPFFKTWLNKRKQKSEAIKRSRHRKR
jgi:hypothetical protein